MNTYAARIEGTTIVQVIVGDARWASESLGGAWVDLGTNKAAAGWSYVDGSARPPAPHESWVWGAHGWEPPIAEPEPADGGAWDWNEAALSWDWYESQPDIAIR